MNIEHFDDLLQAARTQALPQRLLLVFATAELPDDATAAQRAAFAAGEGGALVPAMCVDKGPDELSSFAGLVQEAEPFVPDWRLVFAAALSGNALAPPDNAAVDAALHTMVERIRQGDIGRYLPFDRQGMAVNLG